MAAATLKRSARCERVTTLGAELRKRFKSPREALARLGIDEEVLKRPGLAYDMVGLTMPNEGLSDEEVEALEAQDEEIQRRIENFLGFLRERIGDSEKFEELVEDDQFLPLLKKEIADRMRRRRNGHDQPSLPKNSLAGGFGGRIHKEEQRLAERQKARDKRMARDERRREEFENFFPETVRLTGTPLEAGIGNPELERAARRTRPPSERRIAADSRAERDFAERFPTAARIGVA